MDKAKTNLDNFIKEINTLVLTGNLTVMDAVIHYCEKNGVEIEAAARIIKSNPKIKVRLQNEAEELNFLPKRATVLGIYEE